MTATNTIDITALTDAAFDRFMEAAAAGTTDFIEVDDLTARDRRSLAVAYGWDLTAAFVRDWIGYDAPTGNLAARNAAEAIRSGAHAAEEAILRRQDRAGF